MKNHKNQFIAMNNVKTDYPCNLKLKSMHFFTIIFPIMAQNLSEILNITFVIEHYKCNTTFCKAVIKVIE